MSAAQLAPVVVSAEPFSNMSLASKEVFCVVVDLPGFPIETSTT